jgi:hypothetical protein
MSLLDCGLGGLRGKLEVVSFVSKLEYSDGGGLLTERSVGKNWREERLKRRSLLAAK